MVKGRFEVKNVILITKSRGILNVLDLQKTLILQGILAFLLCKIKKLEQYKYYKITYIILPCRRYNCNIFKHKGEKYIEQYNKNQICNR